MRRRRCRNKWRRLDKKGLALLLLIIGIGIIVFIILPRTICILMGACIMVYIGYKLFCCH
ncbi:hypothetical protein IZY60_01445 [Lutibacter sp. B2]|nr:hypothetical protein [Lutibacter sp. B2]